MSEEQQRSVGAMRATISTRDVSVETFLLAEERTDMTSFEDA
jgi:hypothetical protein